MDDYYDNSRGVYNNGCAYTVVLTDQITLAPITVGSQKSSYNSEEGHNRRLRDHSREL